MWKGVEVQRDLLNVVGRLIVDRSPANANRTDMRRLLGSPDQNNSLADGRV
jgi:hypothetical protein